MGALNIASITVSTGTIGAIEGYRDAILSGPIIVAGPNRVDRIAFQAIAPGGAIGVGGDLNTLDVLNDANFTNSTGLFVGRDLNHSTSAATSPSATAPTSMWHATSA